VVVLCALLAGFAPGELVDVWMSHGDRVATLPPGFLSIASSPNAPFAACANHTRRIYGVQFHPEVVHTPRGAEMLRRQVVGFLEDVKAALAGRRAIPTGAAEPYARAMLRRLFLAAPVAALPAAASAFRLEMLSGEAAEAYGRIVSAEGAGVARLRIAAAAAALAHVTRTRAQRGAAFQG
jgi:hypothetical protein